MAAESSPILSAFSSVMMGRSRSREMAAEAQMSEIQAKGVDLQAKQMSERRREEFRANRAAVEAVMASQNRDPDSPSAIAIEKELRRQAVRDESVERVGFVQQAGAYRMQAAARRRGAKNAIMASMFEAGGKMIDGVSDAMTPKG